MPANRFKMIHVEDPDTKKLYPLMIKKFKTDKKKKQLVLSPREISRNVKVIPQYGGLIVPILKGIAPTILSPIASWAIGKLMRKIFGKGLNDVDDSMHRYRGGSIDIHNLPFMAKVLYNGFIRGLKKKNGGRLYLGKGLKPAKMYLEGPFPGAASQSMLTGLPTTAALETYRVK